MAKKITELAELTSTSGSNFVPIVDRANSETKKITVDGLIGASIMWATSGSPVIIPGLAGSADIKGSAGTDFSEEWDTETTGLTWSSTPSSVDSNTTLKSHLTVKIPADYGEYLGTRSWTPSGAFDVRLAISGVGSSTTAAQNLSNGLIVMNSDNSLRVLIQLNLMQSTGAFNVSAYTYSGSYTQRGIIITIPAPPIYLRHTRDASNNIASWYSLSGKPNTWLILHSTSFTFTVAKVGVKLMNPTGGNQSSFVADWLRASV